MTGKHAQQLLHLYDAWNDASLSAHSREVARMGILDCVGCIVAGAPTPTARMVRELATEQGIVAQSSVLGTRLKLSPPLAALANGVAGHVLDYDDMSSTLLGHPSVVLVPAIFALAEARATEAAARLQDLENLDRLEPLIDVLCPAEDL